MGFLEALTLILVVLKALNLVHFSWLLVFTPLIAALGFYSCVFILAIALGGKIVMRRK